jgi:hypothetical protein
MVSHPMPAEDLLVLLDLVEPALEGWRLKAKIVQRIGAVPGGDWFGAPDAARLVGKSRGWCRLVLAELDDQRVLLRYGTDAGGRRIWCAVNSDWEQWRRVPWREDRHTIRERLAYVRERRQVEPLLRFIAFSGHSHPRYAQLAQEIGDGKRDATLNGANGSQHRVLLGAENAVTPFSGTPVAFSDPNKTRSGGEHRDQMGMENAITEIAERLYTLSLDRSIDLSSSRAQSEREDDQQQQQRQAGTDELVDDVELVVEAISARTGCPVFGRFRDNRIPEAVAKWGAPALLRAIDTVAPGGLDAPRYFTQVEQHLWKQQEAASAAALAAAEQPLRDELRQLKDGLAQLTHLGHELPAADIARHNELCHQFGEGLELPYFVVKDRLPPDAPLSDDLAAKIAAAKARTETTLSTPESMADA